MTVNKNILFTLFVGFSSAQVLSAQQNPPNILFIGVDDLNCDFGAYGNPYVHSPNLDSLAQSGVLFANNHTQKAVCGPSRASLLSGFTPEHTGITSFYMYLRDLYPDVVTLPQFFKNKGYNTVGMGKIHDPRNVSVNDKVDLVSWTNFIDISGNTYAISPGKPVVEMADVVDEDYTDGLLAEEGVKQIASLSAEPGPFFLAVGFKKPHLPFAAPKRYWDLYDRDSIPLAPFRKYAENDQAFVHNPGAEFRNNYDNVPMEGAFPYELQREYIHGYYACVSYIDNLIGRLIHELKIRGVYDNTIIVLWGDHGFSLGDHTNWGKHTNFEHATRCPLVIKMPGGISGKRIESPTELLDIYPTLVDIAGFAIPDTLDGNSLKPILSGATDKVKSFAVSQFKREGNQGFALRSDYFQYVEWKDNDLLTHRQLFNFTDDPFQTFNLYLDPRYAAIQDTFSFRLNQYLETGENTDPMKITENIDSLRLYRKFNRLDMAIFSRGVSDVQPLDDAIINIGNFSLPTGKTGYTSAMLQPGIYNYTIEKENFYPATGVINLAVDTVLTDTLVRQYFSVDFQLEDFYSGEVLPGVEMSTGDKTYMTGLDGSLVVSLEPGRHDVTMVLENYHKETCSIEIDRDTTMVFKLRPSSAELKFVLKEGLVPVNEAVVNLNELSLVTNTLGIATFKSLPVDSSYVYTVSKETYKMVTGSVLLQTDTTVEISMEPALFTLTMEIADTTGKVPIENAEVVFGDSLKVSDGDGKVIFRNIEVGSYQYEVKKEGYSGKQGMLDLDRDTTLNVYLGESTSVYCKPIDEIVVYPNPAQDFIRVQTGYDNSRFVISDLVGKTLLSGQVMPSDFSINVSLLRPGIYILTVTGTGIKPYRGKFAIKK